MGTDLKGDFIGFWLDDIHSSELGIIRTSNGSRFDQNLLPTIQDKTVQVPGADGFYYFGSYYTQRQFNIPIAFDNMEEADFRKLNRLIGSKKMMKLVFDETPYKYYNVKSTGSSNLKYVCFDVEDESSGGSAGDVYAQTTTAVTKRVYKGEGTLNFIAYDPFGYARADSIENLVLPDNTEIDDEKVLEWSFNIPYGIDSSYQYPLPASPSSGAWGDNSTIQRLASFNNSGDYECDYQIFCRFPNTNGGVITISDLQYDESGFNAEANVILQLEIPSTVGLQNFVFDSRTNCVYNFIANSSTDNSKNTINYNKIYNKYLKASNFGKLPVGASVLYIEGVGKNPYIKPFFKYF